MSTIQVIRFAAAALISIAALFALVQMVQAEEATGKAFTSYFQWALAGGVIFLAIGVGQMIFDPDDRTMTDFEDETGKK